MKTSVLGLISAIIGGFLSYFIIRSSLIIYLWAADTELTGGQRYWVHEQSDLVVLVGLILGAVTVVKENYR